MKGLPGVASAKRASRRPVDGGTSLAAIATLLIFNVTLRHWSSYLALAVPILFGATLLYQPATLLRPLDHHFGNSVWDQRSNYLYRGATLHTLQEGARYFAHARVPPDPDRALGAALDLLSIELTQ